LRHGRNALSTLDTRLRVPASTTRSYHDGYRIELVQRPAGHAGGMTEADFT
jgi:hypothetical protein